jgi:hypothetical protein
VTILVMLAVMSMNVATYMDFRIRKKIIAFEVPDHGRVRALENR